MLTFIEAGTALARRCRSGLRPCLDALPLPERVRPRRQGSLLSIFDFEPRRSPGWLEGPTRGRALPVHGSSLPRPLDRFARPLGPELRVLIVSSVSCRVSLRSTRHSKLRHYRA